jgi:hypothetical protein
MTASTSGPWRVNKGSGVGGRNDALAGRRPTAEDAGGAGENDGAVAETAGGSFG